MRGIIKLLCILIALSGTFSGTDLKAQNSSSSPYSRYGIGDLLFNGFSKNLAMGGIGQGVNENLNVNPLNPASYSSLWFTTYEAGVNLSLEQISSNNISQSYNTAALAYFAFGFPVKTKKWGMGFGLLPYSNVGYSVEKSQVNSLGEIETHSYKGSGGLNQFYLTNGFSLAKNFSVGLTASYLFGVINQDRRVEFLDPSYYNTNISNSNSLGWFHFNFGLQYTFDSLKVAPSDSISSIDKQLSAYEDSVETLNKLIDAGIDDDSKNALLSQRSAIDSMMLAHKEMRSLIQGRVKKSDWDFTLGLSFAPAADLRARQSLFAYNFRYYNTSERDQVIIRDTIANTDGVKGDVRLPLSGSFGFAFKKGNRWIFGSDYSIQQWSDYSSFGLNDSLVDSWKVNIGGQFTPNERALKAYWKQVQYRLGFHYAKTFLEFNGKHVDEMAATIGFGFPIRRAGTTVQLSAELGKRGTIQSNLIEEKYVRFTLGFSLNDRWFIKPKYD